jgi:integrase/recombinase XerD
MPVRRRWNSKGGNLEGQKNHLEGGKKRLECAWRSGTLQVKSHKKKQVIVETAQLGCDFEKGIGGICTTGLFVIEIFEKFAQELQLKGYSENTIRSTFYHVKRFLKTIEVSPCRTGSDDIQKYIGILYETGRYCTRSIRANIQSLKRFYRYLHRTGQILFDPAALIEAPEEKQILPKSILSSQEMESIRKAVSGASLLKLRDKAIIEILYSTGLRLSELAGLDIADIDLDAGILRVEKGKGGRERLAVMNPEAVSAVKTYLKCRRKTRNETNALWINTKGDRLSGQWIRIILIRAAKKTGVTTKSHPHAWRHGLATSLLRQGANIVEVQRFLGHVSIRSTQIYTHVMIRDLKEMHRRCHPRERDPIPSNITPFIPSPG